MLSREKSTPSHPQTDRKEITEMSRMNNLEGIRFGRLIALEPIGKYKKERARDGKERVDEAI